MVSPRDGRAGSAGPGRARPGGEPAGLGRTVRQTDGPSGAGEVQAGPGTDRFAVVPIGPRS